MRATSFQRISAANLFAAANFLAAAAAEGELAMFV